ncbi:hypothetical protein NDU88_005485 [Pleurodeles waltl]|uniref:Uncharacterized protein n=1 Tax=Pleurodeles waltl TaxID=8319 RepID=A0AAV7QL44_PLEWA|nr:hypothetical protein NDU88_005485 [Pleurodeles waltl]
MEARYPGFPWARLAPSRHTLEKRRHLLASPCRVPRGAGADADGPSSQVGNPVCPADSPAAAAVPAAARAPEPASSLSRRRSQQMGRRERRRG